MSFKGQPIVGSKTLDSLILGRGLKIPVVQNVSISPVQSIGSFVYDNLTQRGYFSNGTTWNSSSGTTYSAGTGITILGTIISTVTTITDVSVGPGVSLIGGGSNPAFTLKTLVAGTNVSLTSTASTITIDATSTTGVSSLTGTINQIVVSSPTGAITISLPSAVTITSSLTVSGLTTNAFLYSGTGGLITSTSPPTNGQLLIGSTGVAPVRASLIAGSAISVTNGAGTISIANTGVTSILGTSNQITVSASTGAITVSLPSSVTVTTSLTVGGLATNAFLYSGTSGLLATTSPPTNGQLLIGLTGAAPGVGTLTAGSGISIINGAGSISISSTGVTSFSAGTTGFTPNVATSGAVTLSGALNAGNGGTGVTTTPTSGQLLVGNGTSYTLSTITPGSGISVTNGAGSISVANSGVTSLTGSSNQITVSASTGAVTVSLPSAVIIDTSLTVSGLTSNSFLYSGVAGLLTTTSAPSNGQLLIGSTGGSPVISTITAGTGISVTNAAGSITITNTNTVTEPFYTSSSRAIISGVANTFTAVSSTSGGAVIGGTTSTSTIVASAGGVIIGGRSMIVTISGGPGSAGVSIGGSSRTVTVGADGGVGICAGGTVGASIDTNLVLIGGTSSSLFGSGNVCIGSSTTTQTFSPSTGPQTYIKANPISARRLNVTSYTTSTSFTVADFIGGYIDMAPTVILQTFTFPSASSLYTALVDSSGSPFGLLMSFTCILNNTGTQVATLAAGAGNTLGGVSSIGASGVTQVKHITYTFLSSTTGVIMVGS